MEAYLKDRLYVPVKYIDDAHLSGFTHRVPDPSCARCKDKNKDPDTCLDCPLSEPKEIITYKRFKGYYIFCRGDLGKIYKVFSDFDIVNDTCKNKFKYGLKFTSSLWDNQKDTVNKWLKYGYGMIESPPRSGKAQPLHSLIKVPNGWKRMGDMCVGDSVNVPDGGTAYVTGVFPQGVKDVYKITFEDGRSTECCEDHLWKVYGRNWRKTKIGAERVKSLEDIISYEKYNTLFIPLPEKIYGEEKDLPLDPYVLGVLLRDSTYTKGCLGLTNIDFDLLKLITSKLEKGYCLKKVRKAKYDYIICRLDTNRDNPKTFIKKGGFYHHYHKIMNDLGLLGKHSYEKFIPDIYKEASYEQRLEIIRGLMDTDGTVCESSSVSFSTTSYQLALDMQYLIRSVGGLCKISVRNPFYKWEKKAGRISYRLNIRHNNPEILFNISRKKERAARKKLIKLRCSIKSIEYVGSEQCQCIAIDHPDHLYITDDFIVTHNTIMACSIICSLGYKTLILFHQEDLGQQFLSTFEKHTNLNDLRRKYTTDKIVGLTNCRKDLDKYDVCLSTYQSFIRTKGKEYLKAVKDSFGMVVVDECFPKDVEVMIDYDKYMKISEIFENDNITHVLSYDLDKKEIVRKRIIAKSKKLNYDGWSIASFEDNTSLKSTKNHGIITTDGNTKAEEVLGKTCITYKVKDLKRVKYCSKCGDFYHVLNNMHETYCNCLKQKCEYCGLLYYNIDAHVKQTHERSSDKKEFFRKQNSLRRYEFLRTDRGKAYTKKLRNARKGAGNPMYRNLEAAKKLSKTKKLWFASMNPEEKEWRIHTFINAPKHRNLKNKVESKFEKMFPEFTFKPKVEALLNNCYLTVTNVSIPLKSKIIPYKYNLEVEDTHNYFVLAKGKCDNGSIKRTPILVSNCHLAGADCFRKVIDKLNAKHRLGLSATPERKDGLEVLVYDIIGPVTSVGQSDEMHCNVMHHSTNFKVKNFVQWNSHIKRLSESAKRNRLICNYVVQDVKDGRNPLVVSERRKHIDALAKLFQDSGLKVAVFDGRVPKQARVKLLDDARNGKYDVFLAMRKMIKLGIDCALWDTYYHIMPIAFGHNYYQEMSRVRTRYLPDLVAKLGHDKPTPLIRVFVDYGHAAVYACLNIIDKEHEKYGFTYLNSREDLKREVATKKAKW